MRRKRYMTQKRKLKRKRLALLSVLSISMIGLGAGVLFLDNNSDLLSRLGASVVKTCPKGGISNGNGTCTIYVSPTLICGKYYTLVGDKCKNKTFGTEVDAIKKCPTGYVLSGNKCTYTYIETTNNNNNETNYNSNAATECEKAGGTYKKNSAGKYQCVKTSTNNNNNNVNKNSSNTNNSSSSSNSSANNNTTIKE
ncbi:MAG: hypothetical protein J6B64_00805, partial [Bacilli bacterium]|nr:hypothetical protein [Bacilli bacterium]MBP3635411.1 hypothetical protein [Bacilli bacterium]